MNTPVKFEDPESLIFGHLAKNVHMNCMGAVLLPLVISHRLLSFQRLLLTVNVTQITFLKDILTMLPK